MIYLCSGLSRTYKLKMDCPKAIDYLKKEFSIAEKRNDYAPVELIEFQQDLGNLYKIITPFSIQVY